MGASAALALSVAQGVLHVRELGQGPAGLGEPIAILETLAVALLYGAWAYAIAVGSYGSKGALVALAGYTLVFSLLFQGVLSWRASPAIVGVVAALNVLVGGAATVGLVREIAARRGPVQWGTAAFFLAPLALMIAVGLAAQSLTA